MTTAVSMLRGVNLGPYKRVKMDALRELYESLGLLDVQTYVQSGNIVFRTRARSLAGVAAKIEAEIEQRFGFSSTVILRTPDEMRRVVARNPFAERSGIEPSKFLVTFLSREPDEDARKKVLGIPAQPEELRLDGREMYIYFPNGMARPKLSLAAVARALKIPSTGRNWNTVVKLLEMAEALTGKL
ncbi:MAG TPA: DUF1697 domain-containing protein [Bryobacteraceae bacterium]|nr:DUF1697 domain-containing protein [Bryobacteraceae bacterium]